MNNQINNPNPQHLVPLDDAEIDLIALAKTLWNGRRTVIKTTLIFMGIGLFVAIFSQKEYTASTTLVPQSSKGSKLGNLDGLAAMAGINLGGSSGGSEISPTLYPQIINSVPFQLELLRTPLTIKGQDKPISYEDYYTNVYSPGLLSYIKKYTIGLPDVIIGVLKRKPKDDTLRSPDTSGVNNPMRISGQQNGLVNLLGSQIAFEINKSGYINLSVNMPEALAAAQLTQKVQELLQQYVINFKIKKSKEKLKFIKERYRDKEAAFKAVQQKLAHFRDANQNLSSALSQTSLQSLQSEYDLAFSVYSELAKQLETQQIQVKEDTPVFTVLKPVLVPIERAKPKRSMILAIWIFLGVVVGVGFVFGKSYFGELKEKWHE